MAETIEPMAAQIDQRQLAEDLGAQAHADGVQLIGEGGLLTGLTKSMLECAVEEEMSRYGRPVVAQRIAQMIPSGTTRLAFARPAGWRRSFG